MTVTVEAQTLVRMQKEIERLQLELKRISTNFQGFESLDTDSYLTEVYNG